MSQMAPDIREALRERLRQRLRDRLAMEQPDAAAPPERGIGLAAGKGLEAGTYGAGSSIARLAQAGQAFAADPVRATLAGAGRMAGTAGQAYQDIGQKIDALPIIGRIGVGAGLATHGRAVSELGGMAGEAAQALPQLPMDPARRLRFEQAGGAADYLGSQAEAARAQMPTMAHEPFSREWFAAGIAETAPQMAASILATIGGTAVAGPAGGLAAGAAVMFPLEAGAQAEETFKTLVQQGVPPEDALAESFVPAVAYGLASAGVEQGGVQSAVRSGMLRGSIKERIIAAVRGLPGMAAQEAGEEAAQGNIGRAMGGALTGEGPALLSGENAMLSAQEAALGGAAGLGFGGAVGAGRLIGRRAGADTGQTPLVDMAQTLPGQEVAADIGADTVIEGGPIPEQAGEIQTPSEQATSPQSEVPAPSSDAQPVLEVGAVAGPNERYAVASSLASRALRESEALAGPENGERRRTIARAVAVRFRDSQDDITPETVGAVVREMAEKSAATGAESVQAVEGAAEFGSDPTEESTDGSAIGRSLDREVGAVEGVAPAEVVPPENPAIEEAVGQDGPAVHMPAHDIPPLKKSGGRSDAPSSGVMLEESQGGQVGGGVDGDAVHAPSLPDPRRMTNAALREEIKAAADVEGVDTMKRPSLLAAVKQLRAGTPQVAQPTPQTAAQAEGSTPEAAAKRAETIDRIVTAARRDELKVVEITQYKGDNGKWYGVHGTPYGVKLTDERRTVGFAYQTPEGTIVGKTHPTREAAEQAQRNRLDTEADDLRKHLEQMDDESLGSQADYWDKQAAQKQRLAAPLPKKPEASPAAGRAASFKDEARKTIASLQGRRTLTRGEEIALERAQKSLKVDPSKWTVGTGVGYRVNSGGKSTQINRGFRIVASDPVSGRVVVRQVRDTGLTSSGGDSDRFSDTTIDMVDLVRVQADDLKPAPAPGVESAAAPRTQETPREEGNEEGRQGPSVPPVTATPTTTPAPAARATGKGLDSLVEASIDDIDAKLASASHAGTSFSPEKRGEAYRQDYVNTFNAVRDALSPLAKTDEQQAALQEELERFRAGLRQKYTAFLTAHSRVMSPMITGPARFPVESNRKKSDSAMRRLQEIVEFQKKAEAAIRRKLFPAEADFVSSDREDAIEVLEKQVEDGLKLQRAMVAGNKVIRDKALTDEQRREKLKALGISDSLIGRVLKPDYMKRTGFPSYMLQNNLKEVKRLRDRVTDLKNRKAAEARSATFDGGTIEENKAENRVQITYKGKPDEATRTKLKSRGFRWSPRQGVWQRQANEAGWRAALEVTGAKVAGQPSAPEAKQPTPPEPTAPDDIDAVAEAMGPAGKQWARMKRQHPDVLMLFRIGDFYEAFGEDARKMSKATGVTLTQRTAGIPMAGVPFHQLETYLKRLIDKGHRVAVAEVVEDRGKKIERGVTRVVTPGTETDSADVSKMTPEEWKAVRGGELAGKLRPVNRADGAPDATPPKKPTLEQRLDAIIEREQKARKSRTIPRGRNTGATTLLPDLWSLAVEGAARVARAAVRSRKAAKELLAKFAADNNLSERDAAVVRRGAMAILDDATVEDGSIDPDRFENAADALLKLTNRRAVKSGPTTKQTIERTTGVRKDEPKTVTAAEALSAGLRKLARDTAKARREGIRLTMAEARDRMNALRKLARGKDATEKGIREELVRLVEDTLPTSLQGKFIKAAASVKTLAQLQRQIARLRDKLADYRLRLGMKDLRRALKRAGKMKMLDENKAVVADAAAAERRFTDVYTKRMKTGEKVKLIEAVLAEYRKVEEAMANQRASERVRIGNEWWSREEIVTKAVQLLDDHKTDLKVVSGLSHDAKASLIGRANQKMLTPDGVGALLIDPKLRQLLSEDNWIGETEVFKGTQAWEDRKKELLEANGYEWGAERTQLLSAAVSRDKADVVKIKLPDAGEIEGTPAEMMALFGTLTDLRAGRQIENGTPINWGRNRLGKPIRLSPNDVAAFKAGLDPKLKAIVNAGKEFVEQRIRPGVFRAHRALKGWDLDAVPGYYRTARNMKQADPARTDTLKDWDGWAQQALTGLGFLKQRVPSSQTPYVIGDFFDDMNEMVHKGLVFTHMAPRVRTMTIVFNDPRLQSTIERKYGAGLLRQIDDTIHAAKLIFKEAADPAERVSSFVARMYARAVLTLNPRTWMKQLGGIAKIANEIDPKIVGEAIAALRDREVYKATRAEMLADPWFRERYQEAVWRRVTPALGERVPLLGPTKTTDAMRRLLKLSPGAAGELIDRIEILNWFDMQAAMVAWEASKRVHKGDKAAVARAAQFAFRRTQNTSSPLDMSGFALQVRGKVTSMAIMFTSDANKSYNILATAIASRDPKKIARAATAVSINAAWAAVVVAMFGELKDLGEDDEKKRKLVIARWADSFARDLAGMGYLGGDVYDFAKLAVNAAVKGKMPSMWQFTQGFQNPLVSNVLDSSEALLNLFSAPFAQGYMQTGPNRGQSRRWVYLKRFLSQGASAAGKWLGIPYEPPMRVLTDLYRAGRRLSRP